MGLLEKSVLDYTRCLKLDPNHYNAAYARGACENRLGNYDKAIEDYNLALSKDKKPVLSPRTFTIDQVNFLLGSKVRRAASLEGRDKNELQKEIKSPFKLAPYVKIQNCRLLKKEEGIRLSSPNDFQKQENLRVLSSFASTSSIKSNTPFSVSPENKKIKKTEAEELHSIGYNARKAGDYKKAVEFYSKAIELNPEFVQAFFNRAFAYDKLNETSKAIEDYKKVTELQPNNAYAYYNCGIALDKICHFDAAIESFTKAIELLPNKADFHYNRGVAYKKSKNFLEAIEDYSLTIKLDPNYFKVNNQIIRF